MCVCVCVRARIKYNSCFPPIKHRTRASICNVRDKCLYYTHARFENVRTSKFYNSARERIKTYTHGCTTQHIQYIETPPLNTLLHMSDAPVFYYLWPLLRMFEQRSHKAARRELCSSNWRLIKNTCWCPDQGSGSIEYSRGKNMFEKSVTYSPSWCDDTFTHKT